MAWVEVEHCTSVELGPSTELLLQYGTWHLDNGNTRKGYRFIYREDGKLKTYRGQARIPFLQIVRQLLEQATTEGWAGNR